MMFTKFAARIVVPIAVAVSLISCSSNPEPVETSQPNHSTEVAVSKTKQNDTLYTGLKIAFIYGDSINNHYQFLLDAEAELEAERNRIDRRLRNKLEAAEKRAGELHQKAPTMTQIEMQEAQLELQELDLEIQQYQEKLASDFRKRESELQRQYIAKVDAYLDEYNADGTYDMIFNYQQGGNLIWVKKHFDITDDIIKGLNKAYEEELTKKRNEK